MTAHFHTPHSGGGRTCRTCRKWDGVKCADMRHKHNDDPGKPCLLYRYKEQEAVATASDGDLRRCGRCHAFRPAGEFRSMTKPGAYTQFCLRCRSEKNLSQRMKYDRTKENGK